MAHYGCVIASIALPLTGVQGLLVERERHDARADVKKPTGVGRADLAVICASQDVDNKKPAGAGCYECIQTTALGVAS
jgi:hypothetical protein